MSTSIITSREWDDVVGSYNDGGNVSLGTSSGGIQLLEPQRGFAAFSTTFRYMFREEWRENIDFAKKRQVVLFPLLLTLCCSILGHGSKVVHLGPTSIWFAFAFAVLQSRYGDLCIPWT